jgi:hypothetical protein
MISYLISFVKRKVKTKNDGDKFSLSFYAHIVIKQP